MSFWNGYLSKAPTPASASASSYSSAATATSIAVSSKSSSLSTSSKLNQGQPRQDPTPSGGNFVFTLPDLQTTVVLPSGIRKVLIAYKETDNEDKKTEEKRWASVGVPKLLQFQDDGMSGSVVEFTALGWTLMVQLLSEDDQHCLADYAFTSKGYKIRPDQFLRMPISEMTVTMIFVDPDTRAKFVESAKVDNPDSLDVTMEFNVDATSPSYLALRRIQAKGPAEERKYMSIRCEFLPDAASKEYINSLKITARDLSDMNVANQIFGDGADAGATVVVTRNQANDISAYMSSYLSIQESYGISGETFSEEFIQYVVNHLMRSSDLIPMSVDAMLSILSHYEMDFKEDIKPDIINKTAGRVLYVDKEDNFSYIKFDRKEYESMKNDSSSSTEEKASLNILSKIGLDATGNFVESKKSEWIKNQTDLKVQQTEVNTYHKQDVSWDIEGTMIRPKTVKVLQVQKAQFLADMSFERIVHRVVPDVHPMKAQLSLPATVPTPTVINDLRSQIARLSAHVLPIGGIIPYLPSTLNPEWNDVLNALQQPSKFGFVPCNGQTLNDPGKPWHGLKIPNYNSSIFLMGSNDLSTIGQEGGPANNSITLQIQNLPPIKHSFHIDTLTTSNGTHNHGGGVAGGGHSHTLPIKGGSGADKGWDGFSMSGSQRGGVIGGSGDHSHTINNDGEHQHHLDYAGETNELGGGVPIDIRPHYATVVYLMRIC